MKRFAPHDDVIGYLHKLRTLPVDRDLARAVANIVVQVRDVGDLALLESARQFDAPALKALQVTHEELLAAQVPSGHLDAIRQSLARVLAFHREQLQILTRSLEHLAWSRDGVGQQFRVLESVGVYVPGGRAAYPSSVLMNAGPAAAAGVSKIVVCTPARHDGTLHPSVLVALRELQALTGVQLDVFKVGGAAAIAGMAYGTQSVLRVDKIVGPGNRYVNEAKRQVWGSVGLDGYAGPSEVAVLADESAYPHIAAADLLTQIEHAPDNVAFLVTLSEAKADEVLASLDQLLRPAPRAKSMRQALNDHGHIFVARDLDQAIEIVNAIAPEHLSLAVADPHALVPRIHNAGCILLGEWTPESAGDFVAGPSHTLPTGGAARFGSPVNVLDFLKVQSVIGLSRAQLQNLLPVIQAFGEMEDFPTHALGAAIRFD